MNGIRRLGISLTILVAFGFAFSSEAAFVPGFFSTNILADGIEQTNTLILSGFHLSQKTNDISGANGTYTWNGTKYVFNVTNTVSFVGSVSAWCLTNGMSQIAPAVNPVIAADITQTATPTPESYYWFDNAGLVLGRSLFTRTLKQTADGPYAKNQSGNATNLTLWYNTIIGADSTGIRWSGGGNNNGSGTDLVPILNPLLDGGQRTLYIGGPVGSSLEGQLEAASLQVNRTNSSATTHGLLAPRITLAFNNPNGGQYSSWRFELFDLTANNATETGGGGQSLINVSPAGATPTNANFGGPEWTNNLRGQRIFVTATNGLGVQRVNGALSQFLKAPWVKHIALFQANGSAAPVTWGDILSAEGSGLEQIAPSATEGTLYSSFSSAGANTPFGDHGNVNWRVGNNPYFAISCKFTNLTVIRMNMGLTDAATIAAQANSDAVSGNYAIFRYSTAVPDTKWQCVTMDNSTRTVTDSGITPDTNIHRYEIQFNDAVPNVVFFIDGTPVATNTTHLPTSGTNLRYVDGGLTLENVAKEIRKEWWYIESDR